MKAALRITAVLALSIWTSAGQGKVNLAEPHRVASNTPSFLLDASARKELVDTFISLVNVKGSSGNEEGIGAELKRILKQAGATEISLPGTETGAPLNVAMEFAATRKFTNEPAILLNAHIDTVAWSNPERMVFDEKTGDFFHEDESKRGETSSFGGDDRSGVAVVVAAARKLQADFWSKGVTHRRIVLLFTAKEETGCIGAKYLSQNRPDLFKDLAISLCVDGPLDLRSGYPSDSFVAVVAEKNATEMPYRRVLELMGDYCQRTKLRFGHTEYGLGFGDFAYFPASAKSGMHWRSVVRGWHNQERVKVQDLINQVDLMCFVVLAWDHTLPEKVTAEGIGGK
jgi:putative aminopeptidase FrvX